MVVIMATPNKLPGPALAIKTEPGTSRSSSLRLPSFKPPRDMMLGGPLPNIDVRSARKVYVPNLNVQRKKNQEDVVVKVEKSESKNITNSRGARGRGDRGRKSTELLQSTGSVFAEGLAKEARAKESRYGEGSGGGGGGGSSRLEGKITRNNFKNGDINTFSKEDGSCDQLARLLDDSDFIDDPGICPDEDFKPQELPSFKIKREIIQKKEIKKPINFINGLKVKQEPAEVVTVERYEDPGQLSYPQLFSSSSPKLVLMKLPSGLAVPDSNDSEIARPSTSVSETAEKTPVVGCDLPEGQIGKLQLMKSGNVRLVIGNHMFNSQLGTYTNMKQDVMVINLHPNGTGGDSINLGPIDAHIVTSRLTLDSQLFNPASQPIVPKLET